MVCGNEKKKSKNRGWLIKWRIDSDRETQSEGEDCKYIIYQHESITQLYYLEQS